MSHTLALHRDPNQFLGWNRRSLGLAEKRFFFFGAFFLASILFRVKLKV